MFDFTELSAQYNCKGTPDKYRFTLENFETQTCSRCGGGGHYSFNMMHGSRCYGCGGTGFQMTKRGAAVLARYRELSPHVAARDLQVGQRFQVDGAFRTVIEPGVTVEGDKATIPTQRITFANYDANKLYRVVATPAEQAAALAGALEFGATLTKLGKPRKGAAVAA